VKPRVVQNGLFIPLAPEPEKLELTLARLIKLLGPERVGSPELIDTHRPDAFRIKRFVLRGSINQRNRGARRARNPKSAIRTPKCFLAFRVFRPPLRALVEAAKGYPTQISAWSADRSVHGSIVRMAGPWRTTGDWWRANYWARDEWDVAVESRSAKGGPTTVPLQVLYRIYREVPNGSWFVEGIYD
jgi:protein ImuB